MTAACPVCGGLIGWNRAIVPAPPQGTGTAPFVVLLTLDDLSPRRHRGCGIMPPAS
jgi:hypothetical protein